MGNYKSPLVWLGIAAGVVALITMAMNETVPDDDARTSAVPGMATGPTARTAEDDGRCEIYSIPMSIEE
jgi:hypothetical protein